VAGTITWAALRELAAFRATRGCAISLYLDLDPSVAPTAGDVQTRVTSLLHEAERRLESERGRLGREARDGALADLARIQDWFRTDFDRDGTRGLAVFADAPDNLWSTISSGEPVGDAVHLGDELRLAPLARLAAREAEALVTVVGRERGHVYRLDGARLVEVADRTEAVPGQHDQGGRSQARYERHIEDIVEHHLKRVAETLDRCVRALRGACVVLVGTAETLAEFEEMLAHDTRAAVAGRTSVEAHADAATLLAAVRPVLDAWWAKRETKLVERWRREAAKNGRAASGWEATLEAASDGRVETLLVEAGADRPAYECPRCGRAQLTDGSCPLDGAQLESRDAGIDVAVHRTLENGGRVQVIRDRSDLDPVGGLGALLRF
jgi:peptide chain release factor subunit 1